MVGNLCLKLLKLFLFLSLANAEVSVGVGELPASPALRRIIAEDVCAQIQDFMFLNQTSAAAEACPDNFHNVESAARLRSDVKVRCRWAAAALTLEAAPCSRWQVAVLLADDEGEAPSYALIQGGHRYSDIEVPSPRSNYTLYSSVLRAGRAAFWRRHERVPAWDLYNAHVPEHKEYAVQVHFVNYTHSEAGGQVTGVMSWNHTGDADACFTFTNHCNRLQYMNLWPDAKHRAVVTGLPLEEACLLEVSGLHGSTQLHYRTPARALHHDNDANIRDVSRNATLEVPKIVYIEAVEEGHSWAVRVAWARPRLQPDRYTVVLRANAEYVLNVTGNATECVVRGVAGAGVSAGAGVGAGVYNVSLFAYKGNLRAHTYKRAMFIRSSAWRWVGAAAGSAWAGALALLAVALCWLRLNTRRLAHNKAAESEECKPLEEEVVRALGCEGEEQWEINIERVLLHEVIGVGAFGKVRRGVLAPAGTEVAVKMLRDYPTADDVRAFRHEIEVMKSVGAHSHVVSLLGCCSGSRPMMVQEYCARGDLLQLLRRSWDAMVKHNSKYYNNNDKEVDYRNDLFTSKPECERTSMVVNKMYEQQGLCDAHLTAQDLLSFCRQIAKGMEFLASNRLVHRDLAARNVLVTSDRTLKIADFGLTRDVYEESQYRQKGNTMMPIKWMAPESLTRLIYTSKSDVWSFGIVLWEVTTFGSVPYPEVPPKRVLRLLRTGYRMPCPVNCSKQLYEVMLSCWHASPCARPSFPALYRRLDEMLQSTCAEEYLTLDLEEPPPEPEPPEPPEQRMSLDYLKTIMNKRGRSRETYERPLKPPRGTHNHYTSPPATPAPDPA